MTIPPEHVFSGTRMKAARKAVRLSLWKLSALLARRNEFVTPMHLSRIERGLYVPRARVFLLIAHFTKRKPEAFFVAPSRRTLQAAPRKRKRTA